MALFKKFKYAFGFGPSEDEIISDDPDTEITASGKSASATSDIKTSPRANIQIEINDDEATSAIFEHVVEIFNKSLPDFLKQSVDPEAERKFLYDTLTSDLKQYLSSIAERTQQQCQDSWNADKERLQENVRELENKAKNIEEKREELSQKQLSVERQRRALSDRVVDLEKQVMTYEAEREQFQLENKSLVNKLKVASVNEKDIDAMREEIDRLREELNNARKQNVNNSNQTADANENSEKVAALEQKVSELEQALADSEKSQTSTHELEEKIVQYETQLAESKDREEKANQELELLKTKVNDADALTKELSEIENQIAQFEQIKNKKDAKINDLTLQLASANEMIDSFKDTVSKLTQEKNDSETKLKQEIDQLKTDLVEAKQAATAEPKVTEKRASKGVGNSGKNRAEQSSHIDDILSDTDWLVSPSSLKSNKNGQANGSNSHSSNQNKQDKNDAQMTLF